MVSIFYKNQKNSNEVKNFIQEQLNLITIPNYQDMIRESLRNVENDLISTIENFDNIFVCNMNDN